MRTFFHILPEAVKFAIHFLINCFRPYRYGDNSNYWIGRSMEIGQKSVLWSNQDYNNLLREVQHAIIAQTVKEIKEDSSVLDIGCGIGILTKMLIDINPGLSIDAVDFKEMIMRAQQEHKHLSNVHWIDCPAERYLVSKQYDLIISSACYSSIKDLNKCRQAMDNGVKMLKAEGILLLIDPWHKWRPLARARMNTKEVEIFMEKRGLKLEQKGGMLFWPSRVLLANSQKVKGISMQKKFKRGESILALLGSHFWADYKLLLFKKKS
jgi:SAM-dependent methyltransferase